MELNLDRGPPLACKLAVNLNHLIFYEALLYVSFSFLFLIDLSGLTLHHTGKLWSAQVLPPSAPSHSLSW